MTKLTEIASGLGLLGAIVSATLYVGHFWGESDAQRVDRPVLMDRRDREIDALRDDIRELRQKPLCPCHE
jgi:hypothetical protein